MQERTGIQGWTTLTKPSGAQSTLPGGILATTANIGNYYRSPFSVVPEAYLNLGFQLNPSVALRVGYSFIYASNVLRPGNQVNRTTSANLIPSDPTYGSAVSDLNRNRKAGFFRRTPRREFERRGTRGDGR
jgi:hypothetical protein